MSGTGERQPIEPTRPRPGPAAPPSPGRAPAPVPGPAPALRQSPWRLNHLGVLLSVLLVYAAIASGGLWLRVLRMREQLAEAQAATERAEAALAKEQASSAPTATAATEAAAPGEDEAREETQPVAEAAPAGDHLLLLVTVGSRSYAERQLRLLQRRCKAPLAVYRQRRGRCAWEQCFVVAAPATEAARARGCGQAIGQTLRDRADFAER